MEMPRNHVPISSAHIQEKRSPLISPVKHRWNRENKHSRKVICKMHLPVTSHMYTRLQFRSTLKVKKMLDWQNATECGTIAEKICLFSCRAYWAVRSKSDVCLVYKSLFEDCAFLFCYRELDLNEAQCLVAGLNSGENTLVSEMVTMANCAAFTTSQDSLSVYSPRINEARDR